MAYIQVEASVRTHRKFLKAGPAASWLWLCGMGYCQDGLTDGFIPAEAIDFLGIKGADARRFAATLIKERLWEAIDGGWRVHDYLEHNKSAAEINHVKATRGAGGSKGGRPRKEPSGETSKVPEEVNHTENPSHLISATAHLVSSPATPAPRATPLVGGYRQVTNNAYFSATCGSVPHFLHAEFVGKLMSGGASDADADRDARKFYEAIEVRFAGKVVGDDPVKFWRARFSEQQPRTVTPATSHDRRPEWLRKPRSVSAS